MTATWRQQQAEKLNNLLYETALKLFRERGYESTSISRITNRIGIAKGTFFNYYQSKDHVLAKWYQELTFSVLQKCRETNFPKSEAAVRALAVGLVEGALIDPELFASKSRNWSETISNREERMDLELMRYLTECIEDGKKSGELRDSLDTEFFAGLVVSVMTGTGHSWVVTDFGFDLLDVMESRIEFIFTAARS